MAIVLRGSTNDITINGVSVATDTEVASAVSAAVPTGTVISVAVNSTPTGYLKCNGALISRTTYAALFATIGTTFGVGDGTTTFGLPDLRGEFIRGWDDGRGVDTARVFGSAQSDELKSHRHTDPYQLNGGVYNYLGTYTHGNGATSYSGYEGGTETRPRNIAMLYCIKY